jgi:hypothetical protein
MSRFEKLENTFDLPPLSDTTDLDQALSHADKLTDQIKNLDPEHTHDAEMDEISHLAVEYGKTLHDLGMSVDVKNAGEIFTASSNMLKVALDARNSKMERRLKMLKLELDRIKLERTHPEHNHTQEAENVTVLDRNTLLAQIRELGQPATK